MKKPSNILFIYISFFGYEREIINTLKKNGFQVFAFDERISNLKSIKLIYRFIPFLGRILTTLYFYFILYKVSKVNQLSHFFVLKGEVTPRWFINKIKKRFPIVKTIYYTWDSFKNNSNGLDIFTLFEKKISFDFSDCKKYDLKHRPLFSSLNIKQDEKKSNPRLAASVFTVHTDRIYVLRKIINRLKQYHVKTQHYAYTRIKKFDSMKYSKVLDENIILQDKPLEKEDLKAFMKEAKFIIDINHPQQSGLTMRTFEALFASKKLISTNSNLKKYIFYNENNICIIDREKAEIPEHFIKSEFQDYNKELKELMTLEGWLNEVLSNEPMFKWIS